MENLLLHDARWLCRAAATLFLAWQPCPNRSPPPAAGILYYHRRTMVAMIGLSSSLPPPLALILCARALRPAIVCSRLRDRGGALSSLPFHDDHRRAGEEGALQWRRPRPCRATRCRSCLSRRKCACGAARCPLLLSAHPVRSSCSPVLLSAPPPPAVRSSCPVFLFPASHRRPLLDEWSINSAALLPVPTGGHIATMMPEECGNAQ